MATSTEPESPRRIAQRYQLEEVLGRGAMGQVWAAHDEMLGRPVAVKELFLPPGIPEAEAAALRERTLREARSIAALTHPNVITLYDVVVQEDEPYIVMELVPSRSLAEVARDGPIADQKAAIIGVAVSSALRAAHTEGITHRDVKPGNVLVADDGRVKLTDFGIARNPADTTLTAAGFMLGSPAFMAPEVASGKQVGPAADLWGLGATLFAAIEGHPPYDVGGDPLRTIGAVVHGQVPSPTRTGPMAEVVTGLMVKDPASRMTLTEVRRLLLPLCDDAASTVFPLGLPLPGSPFEEAPPEASAPKATPLAAEPGPLPFALREPAAEPPQDDAEATEAMQLTTPSPSPPAQPTDAQSTDGPPSPARPSRGTARRSGVASLALALAAVLVFAAGTVGAFGGIRAAVGSSALPGLPWPSSPPAAQPPGNPEMATRQIEVSEPDGSAATSFAIDVPTGWAEYREQRSIAQVRGTATRFLSPDGTEVLAVERATRLMLIGDLQTYLEAYQTGWASTVDHYELLTNDTLAAAPGGAAPQQHIAFRTVDTGAGGEMRRTTYLHVLPTASDLWIIRVTVPTERAQAGAGLLNEVVPTFRQGAQ